MPIHACCSLFLPCETPPTSDATDGADSIQKTFMMKSSILSVSPCDLAYPAVPKALRRLLDPLGQRGSRAPGLFVGEMEAGVAASVVATGVTASVVATGVTDPGMQNTNPGKDTKTSLQHLVIVESLHIWATKCNTNFRATVQLCLCCYVPAIAASARSCTC